MGLQIGNSKVKEVKIGKIGTSTDYTFTNQPDFTLQGLGYKDVDLMNTFEMNSRIKGTLTFSMSNKYDIAIQQSDGTMKYSSVTGTVVEFDAYCVIWHEDAVRIRVEPPVEGGQRPFWLTISFENYDHLLTLTFYANTDYITDPVTVTLTNFQYGTLSTTPTVSYHNIKEIYVGSNKVFPVKQTGWVTAWEGTFNYTTNGSKTYWFEGSTPIEGATKYRITGTVYQAGLWNESFGKIKYINTSGTETTLIPDTKTYDLSNIELGASPKVYMYIRTTTSSNSLGTKGEFGIENNKFRIKVTYGERYNQSQSYNITKIEAYIPE